MWYDATSAAGSLEAPDSPVRGKIGYAPAPVVQDEALGLALRLVVEHPAGQQEEGQRLEVHLVGVRQGVREPRRHDARLVHACPAGKRASTYENPDYLKVAKAFAEPTRTAIETADPENPGVQPRPAIGIQFVDIPEFPDLGHPGLAGRQLGDRRPDERRATRSTKGQGLADDVAERYRSMQAGQ